MLWWPRRCDEHKMILGKPDMFSSDKYTLKAVMFLDEATLVPPTEVAAGMEDLDKAFAVQRPDLDPWVLWAKVRGAWEEAARLVPSTPRCLRAGAH
jgi:hypothetical protein